MPATLLVVGQRVRATKTICEGGTDMVGDPRAPFDSPNFIHAVKGDMGTVADVGAGVPTVRWDASSAGGGTATVVVDNSMNRGAPPGTPAADLDFEVEVVRTGGLRALVRAERP